MSIFKACDIRGEYGKELTDDSVYRIGRFPNRDPNSAVPGNLSALCRMVEETGARLGVAFDGDGDRVSFVDERGRFLPVDKGIVILAGRVLHQRPGGKVIYDLKCSAIVPEFVREAGGAPLPERSGHTFIKTRMISEDAAFGGELSGHYFYRELHGGDDGLYTALVMADLLSTGEPDLSALADFIPQYSTTPELRAPVGEALDGHIETDLQGNPCIS